MNDINKAMLLSQLKKVQPSTTGSVNPPASNSSDGNQSQFDAALDQASQVHFSKHAEKRLQSRNIELGATERAKLNQAIGSLNQKGAKDSLVLMGNMAFVVNVPSKTVITALTKDQMKEQVFTNIDSTMLIDQ